VGVETDGFPRAEEALRLLSTAAGAARLYPSASPIPAEAVARFSARANDMVGSAGPMRIIVDPHGFRIGDSELGAGNSQVLALAEALHALQVGQLIIAPGLTDPETTSFIAIANADPAAVRALGGPRSALISRGVSHIAVIEVSLRSSDETGLLGIDLMAAPLDDIASEVVAAAERWRKSSGADGDEMATAIDRLEAATRQLAIERVAQALMRLDETSRMKVLAFSLQADTNGARAEGMLAVVANMKPAALARLLMLVAAQAPADPRRVAAALPLASDKARLMEQLLAPTRPGADDAANTSASQLAEEMAEPRDTRDLERQVAIASPRLSAGRALATAVAVSRVHPDPEAARAIGDSLAQAARDGAFPAVRGALRRLDELAQDHTLTDAVASAKAALNDAAVLADVCSAVATDADAAIAGEILSAAGPAGAEALLNAYVRAPEAQRSLLRPVLRLLSDAVLGVARSRLRTDDPATAVSILHTLSALGDRRAVPIIAQGLGHLDESVRFAAITALADTNADEAAASLIKALSHAEPATQRFAVREIGRVKAAPAVHHLTRALEDLNVLRSHELKKEIIRALEQIGTPDAERALRRTADRKIVWGRKRKELRSQAREALKTIRDAAPPRRS
jgi:HEAT repeat protein